GGGRVGFYEGNYSDYLPRRPTPEPEAPRPKAESKPEARPEGKRPERRRLSFREQQELAGMEAAITEAEARVAELEAQLADPAIYKDRGAEVPGLTSALAAAKQAVEALFERWQVLSELEQAAR